jgi:hypothetical protein
MAHSVGLHCGPQSGIAGLAQRQKPLRSAHATQHARGETVACRRAPSTSAGSTADDGSVAPPR